ncbi:hypothetical protein KPL76_06115 [Subtercola sp. PAMC28395]|uniref:hypothetical protein n=1 Tax=Subtercola sp. PAMC28395 TaxID=2846775 RepID=UPI001C0CDD22|nr:hypothetical protein [Subtercola sp. PAMC28395]QWT24928.1 hypothetical protein KPL76_06115 [Subtercola sp. PAMC28395]
MFTTRDKQTLFLVVFFGALIFAPAGWLISIGWAWLGWVYVVFMAVLVVIAVLARNGAFTKK